MRILMAFPFMVAMMVPALGNDVPFAEPSSTRLGSSSDAYYNTLGDIMGLTQLRHIKLWYAGRSESWPLVGFEVDQIQESFDKAAMFYRDIPLAYIAALDRSLGLLKDAVKAKNAAKFTEAYNDLTKACNGCHQAAQVGFISIQTPTASPFSDQKF